MTHIVMLSGFGANLFSVSKHKELIICNELDYYKETLFTR